MLPEKNIRLSVMDSDKFGEKMSFKQTNRGKSIEYSLHNLQTSCEQLAKVAGKMNLMLEYHQSECTNPNSLALLVIETSAHVNSLVNSLKFTTNHCKSQLENLFPGKDWRNFERPWLVPPSSNGSEQVQDADIESASSQGQGSSDSGRLSNPPRQRSEEPFEDKFSVELSVPTAVPGEMVEDGAAEMESSGSLPPPAVPALECFEDGTSSSITSRKRKMSKDPDCGPRTRRSRRTIISPTETSTSPQYSIRTSRRRILKEIASMSASDQALRKKITTAEATGPAKPSSRASQGPLVKELAISLCKLSEEQLKASKLSIKAKCKKRQLKIVVKRLSQEELLMWCGISVPPPPNSCDIQSSAHSDPPVDKQRPPVHDKGRKSKRAKLKTIPQLEEPAAELSPGQTPAAHVAEPSASNKMHYGPTDSDTPAETHQLDIEIETQSLHGEMSPLPDNIYDNVNDNMDYQKRYENDGFNGNSTMVLCNEMSAHGDNDNVIFPPQGPQSTSYVSATVDDKVDTNNDLKIIVKTKRPQRKNTKKVEKTPKMFRCHFCEREYAPIKSIYGHIRTCNENPLNKGLVNEIDKCAIAASRKIPDGPADRGKEEEAKLDEAGKTQADSGAPPEIQIEKSALDQRTIDDSLDLIDIMNDSDVEIIEEPPNHAAPTTPDLNDQVDFGDNPPISVPSATTLTKISPTNPPLQEFIAQDSYADIMHPIPLLKLKIKKKNRTFFQNTTSDKAKKEFALICVFCNTVPTFTSSKAFQWHHNASHAEIASPVIKCSRCGDMLSIEEANTHECTEG